MFSFRQKIFFSYLIIFLVFAIFLYPIVTTLVERIHKRNLQRQVEGLIGELGHAKNLDDLFAILQEKERFLFFRITLYNSEKRYLFDTHLDVDRPIYDKSNRGSLPEVAQALSQGHGYAVRYSSLFSQQMTYVALPFVFQEHRYVLRATFPNGQILHLTHDLTFTFLFFVLFLLLLFSSLAWFIIHYLSQPVAQILEAIRPFQDGQEEYLPEIQLENPVSEFGQLAATLNTLSKRVASQIENLTHEKNEKEAILDSLVEGVVAVDCDRTIIFMNRMAEIFLNAQQQECVGHPFSKLAQSECYDLLVKAQKECRAVGSTLKPTRGQKRFFDIVAAPSGHEEGVILVLQDKTSLHKVIEMGQDFVANSSHELKTPITIIRGFAETLHDHPELSREVCMEITQKIVSNCTRMETLVKNLLTLAAADEGIPQSRLQECDVVQLIEQAKQTTQAVHPNCEISIETRGEPPFRFNFDIDLFHQAILNLLDNAAKYSQTAATIVVRLIKGEGELVIQIVDRGVGIPGDDVDRIFERFYAVDKSHSRALGGSGLGLSIVERIIEKHGGRIEVDSTLGIGTTFIITLPV
ncbi:MAG: Adaptive-response sensory-kinase SasA [Chlamydiales bacterium]|nr:Adaptive-response sensory-kinase SasA [Chlamydiales bacterium]MCH9619620.1 Adaptive-response sensory-kinase SasA [Chlamydiales bacterium]MCH9623226.1 Adaptive-response sensory-kinase SasA [Chlamydiales bacterium]